MCMCGGGRWWGGVAVYVSVRSFVCAVVRVCNWIDLFPVRLHSIFQIGVLIELICLVTAPGKTGCPIYMTPEVPPGSTPVEGETPGTFVQNNVFEGPQYVEEIPDDDKPGPPDDVYKSVEPGPEVGFGLGQYLDQSQIENVYV